VRTQATAIAVAQTEVHQEIPIEVAEAAIDHLLAVIGVAEVVAGPLEATLAAAAQDVPQVAVHAAVVAEAAADLRVVVPAGAEETDLTSQLIKYKVLQ
jgi:hypothetical protein